MDKVGEGSRAFYLTHPFFSQGALPKLGYLQYPLDIYIVALLAILKNALSSFKFFWAINKFCEFFKILCIF